MGSSDSGFQLKTAQTYKALLRIVFFMKNSCGDDASRPHMPIKDD